MTFVPSDYTPFAYERSLRGDRLDPTPAVAHDAGAAGRLLRSPGPVVEPKLSSLAQRWHDQFEGAAQPRALCLRYPRVANRIALCWADPTLTKALFNELMVDRRGGRQGFPPPVQAELQALVALNADRLRSAA